MDSVEMRSINIQKYAGSGAITRPTPPVSIEDEFVAASWRLVAFLEIGIWFGRCDSLGPIGPPPRGVLFDLFPFFESVHFTCDESRCSSAISLCDRNMSDIPLPPF